MAFVCRLGSGLSEVFLALLGTRHLPYYERIFNCEGRCKYETYLRLLWYSWYALASYLQAH